MKLNEAQLNTKYKITQMNFCEPCDMTKDSCDIIKLMERGFIVGEEITIKKRIGNLTHVSLDGEGDYVIREQDSEGIEIQ